ncbi:TonB-dependent receptor [Compostibacter hankyongensis]|uniref:TonB-dependent receptor n=1 Tax=Compostibacter hankyongensis TaxID=1007089 RepID=A0ABP8FJQ1_9BACT
MKKNFIHYTIMMGGYSILIFSIIVASTSLLSAKDGFGQEKDAKKIFLTLQAEDKPLEQIFKTIEQQTKFHFFYDAGRFDVQQMVSLSGRRESLHDILLHLSGQTGLEFKQIDHYFSVRTKTEPPRPVIARPAWSSAMQLRMPDRIIPFSASAFFRADTLIRGTVTDEEGTPLTGVTIQIKGTNRGTVSDVEGHFSFSVPPGATLVCSYVGYEKKEVFSAGNGPLVIRLSANTSGLNEVVVVGYGTQKKSVVTGAISSIKAGDLENQQIGRVEQALQGRSSGLTIASSSGAPGAVSTVRIRGITSLNEGASDPLYVVDGVVVGTGNIDYLNPADIASIEVLKDAASAAIYGARSAAGVILVTTKKGGQNGIHVRYSGYFGTQSPAKRLKLLDASQYAGMINEQSVNGGGQPKFDNPSSLGKGTDWQDLVFNNNAWVQDHEVSISGGSEKSTFYSSFGYFDQQGIVATAISEFKRYNIRLNSSHKITKWLTFGQTLGYSHTKNLGGVSGNTDFGGPLSSAIMLDPITLPVITDPAEADAPPYADQAVERDAHGNPYGISKEVAQQVTNPLAYIQTRKGNYNWSDDIVGNAYLEASPLKGLKLRSTLGTTLSYWGSENFTPLYYLNSNQMSTQTSFARDREKSLNWNIENTISYNHKVGDHDFTVLLGQGAYLDNNSSGLSVTYFNIPATSFKEASMNYNISADDKTSDGYEGIWHTVSSLFGRLNYDYEGKYLFTGVIRRDGSSRFGPSHKYGYFPSASVGWVATQENFWPAKKTINFLKLRGSYGVTGNDQLGGDFRYLSTVGGGRNYTLGDNNYTIGYSPDAPANPDLKWEQTSQLNFGLDAVLFRNWNLTFDWYTKKTTGILQPVTFPGYVGSTGSYFGNVADMENRGMELELGYERRFGAFNLNVRGNISHLKNEVTYLGEDKDFLEGDATLQSSTYELNRTALGHPIGAFFGFQTDGIFQNEKEIADYTGPDGKPIQPKAVPGDFRWVDANHDGQITDADRVFIGNPIPDWSYGFTLNASWKNFDLLVFGQGVAGNQIFQGLRRLDIPTANWQTTVEDRWHGEGTSDTYPRLSTKDDNKNFAYPSDFHLSSGSYFRVKTLQVGYSLPEALVRKAHLQQVRIYLSSNNLFTFTPYTGFDPEIGGSSNNYGIDRGIYPQSRSFLLGLNIGF